MHKNRYTLRTCITSCFVFHCLVGVGDVDTAAALVTELISQVLNGGDWCNDISQTITNKIIFSSIFIGLLCTQGDNVNVDVNVTLISTKLAQNRATLARIGATIKLKK